MYTFRTGIFSRGMRLGAAMYMLLFINLLYVAGMQIYSFEDPYPVLNKAQQASFGIGPDVPVFFLF